MAIIIELHGGKRFKSPAGFCKYKLFLRLRGRRRKIYDYWYFLLMLLLLPTPPTVSIRTRFSFFTIRVRASLPSALISGTRTAKYLFTRCGKRQAVQPMRKEKMRTDWIELKRVTSSLKCDLLNLCIIIINSRSIPGHKLRISRSSFHSEFRMRNVYSSGSNEEHFIWMSRPGTHEYDDGNDDENEAKEIRQTSIHATAITPYTICDHQQACKIRYSNNEKKNSERHNSAKR